MSGHVGSKNSCVSQERAFTDRDDGYGREWQSWLFQLSCFSRLDFYHQRDLMASDAKPSSLVRINACTVTNTNQIMVIYSNWVLGMHFLRLCHDNSILVFWYLCEI